VTNADDTSTLVAAIVDNAKRLGLTWEIVYATVISGSDTTSGLATVIAFDGPADAPTVSVPAVSLIGVLRVGVRVAVLSVPPAGQYIIGALNAATLLPDPTIAYGQAAVANTTSGAFVNMGSVSPTQFTFVKRRNTSSVMVSVAIQLFSSAVPTVAVFALTNGTQIVECARRSFSGANQHTETTGFSRLAGMAAGSHTMNLQWARLSGAGILNTNTEDTISVSMMEITP